MIPAAAAFGCRFCISARDASSNGAVMLVKPKLLAAFCVICAVCVLLCGCVRVIRSPKDEIRLYDWAGEFDNGNTAVLTFDGSRASFTLKNNDFSLTISGLCSLSDDDFVILSEEDGVGYTFGYALRGDSIVLYYQGGALTLEKKGEK